MTIPVAVVCYTTDVTKKATTKVRVSEVSVGMTIEFHGVRPSWEDSKGGPVATWEQIPAKVPFTVEAIEVRYNTGPGVGGMTKSGNREYVLTLNGRQAVVSNQQKVVVR